MIKKSIDDVIKDVNKNFKSITDNLDKKYDKKGGTIDGNVEIKDTLDVTKDVNLKGKLDVTNNVNIKGHLTGTNFTMNTGGGIQIATLGGEGQFLANGSVYFGAGTCHGNTGAFGSCPR